MSATEPQAAELEPRPEQRSCFSEQDLYLFREGSHFKLHERVGKTRALFGMAGNRDYVRSPRNRADAPLPGIERPDDPSETTRQTRARELPPAKLPRSSPTAWAAQGWAGSRLAAWRSR